MDSKLNLFLKKLNLNEEYFDFFKSSTLDKILINKNNKSFLVKITIDKYIPKDILSNLVENKSLFSDDLTYNFTVRNPDNNMLLDYYPYFLDILKSKDKIKLTDVYKDSLVYEDDTLRLIAYNKKEEDRLKEISNDINNFYHNIGFHDYIPVILREDNLIEEEISNELSNVTIPEPIKRDVIKEEPKHYNNSGTPRRRKSTDEGCILGKTIDSEPIKMSLLLGEDNDVTVEGYIFGTDYFESNKSNFKIITLKITDETDSIACKVFCNEDEEYGRLCKALKVGTWLKIRGYTKIDNFSKDELVLNARDIMPVDHVEEEITDEAEEKRVELHAHTMMSQMDGVADEVKLVKQAMKWGHKAIAITDHNGVQAFPHVYNLVRDYNKGKEEKDQFKALYGTELVMVDDNVDIVIRPNDGKLLDQTYVVFDFETTGFNAGGADSIIEIGAVKMKGGEILERYDELINPGRPLPAKITEITNITDLMLEDKDNEENAVKRFIEWFSDLPMVAHNAKFDVSFLEMAYKKYNLGEFKNPVIDTLELSRTLDNNYARHGLSALVKRYNVPWDEESHHRGDYDAEGTALVLYKMLEKLDSRNIETMEQLSNIVDSKEMYKYGNTNHINILALNKKGLKNLFKIVSFANTTYLYKTPKIPRSVINEYREGLLIGSGCYESEVFKQASSKSEEELSNIIRFYDYVEVQPPECYSHLVETGDFANEGEVISNINKIINTTIDAGKLIVATGDVHHLTREDKIYREIIVNQKVPGGGRHPLARGGIKNIPSNHFRTTTEMLEDFSFLDEETRKLIVIDNPKKIADMAEIIEVIIETGGIPFSPKIDKSVETVTELVFTKASDMYGDPLPYNIEERISKELYGDGVYEAINAKLKREEPNLSEDEFKKKLFANLHSTLLKGFDEVKKVIKENLKITDPDITDEDLEKTLKKNLGGVIGGGFDVIYLIAQKLVKHSNDDGYIVGSRGSVGSSFVATMMGITEVNPLPAHYLCRNKDCKYSEFINEEGIPYGKDYPSGYDLKDKTCPKCGEPLGKEGQDMPFATFLGFNADKVPDIDLNFSGEYQWKAHEYTKVLFGVDNVYRAGTIGTVAEKTAYGYVRGYFEEHGIVGKRSTEIERLAKGCTGVKRTTGQHPGGIVVIPGYMDVFDFTPFQYPADDNTSLWRTTHFDYHAIDQDVLKLDILGHDDPTVLRMLQDLSGIDITTLPMDDKNIFSILTTPKALGVTEDEILCPTGTLGLPELGTRFVIQMLVETKPSTFAELVKISGLSHGTDVWAGNASELIRNNIVPFKDVIGCRDDIMVNLMNWGMKPIRAFKIMEHVRKGKATKDPETWKGMVEEMKAANVPEWYIESCHKIKYMFPKAHACAYVMSAIRIAWFKVYKPLFYYAAFFSIRVDDYDIETMIKGYNAIKTRYEDLLAKGFEVTNKESNIIDSLHVALEATARGIKFAPISLEKSDATRFVVDEEHENTLIPPFKTIDGLGVTVAKTIVEERDKQPFLSKEDLQKRGKVSKTLTDKMVEMGIVSELPDSNQLSLF
ncbi:MAG TPA: PolC-type DNA polymerase III [Candidatus Onthousia faecipullorum]|uniref:DNA polymerase III PolC-type n=1 Tax=Candidatus Onthousia faecipullorum TaxID=2840887 RepID=A0A9D1KB46_9FIRM|nr:PolC-type DNA polymerase III [Candidatus Onthousia faecipullorum]